jgi:two-component system chemotaxis sensor kinase CheA
MDDLLDDFLIATAESLPSAEAELAAWEADPSRRAALDAVFRALHTIKGDSGFLRLHRLEALTHAAEDLLVSLRAAEAGAAPAQAAGLLFQVLDRVRETVGHLELLGVEPAGDDAQLIRSLEIAAGSGGSVEPPWPEAPPAFLARPNSVDVPAMELPADSPAEPLTVAEDLVWEAPEPAAAAPAPTPAPPQAARSIRVEVDVLDALSHGVDELVRTRDQLLELLPILRDGVLKAPLQRLSVITGELQDGVARARLQPVGAAWRSLPRLVRDLSVQLGKPVELRLDGGSDLVDREVAAALAEPLAHMVRNSLDHGLETTDERRAAGKQDKGLVLLSAWLEDGELAVRVTDDGRGLDAGRIRAAATAAGWVSEADAAALTDSQAHRLIFAPGFTTVQIPGLTSGRGVGLDVVRAAVDRLGGRISVQSRPGQGASLTLRLPLARTETPESSAVSTPAPAPRRVLLVEENAFFRHMMTPLLTAAGYEVTAAASAEEAWRLHGTEPQFDAVVTDLEAGGPELARRMRDDGRWSAALRVALTDLPVGRTPLAEGYAQVVRKSDRQGLLDALDGGSPERAA